MQHTFCVLTPFTRLLRSMLLLYTAKSLVALSFSAFILYIGDYCGNAVKLLLDAKEAPVAMLSWL